MSQIQINLILKQENRYAYVLRYNNEVVCEVWSDDPYRINKLEDCIINKGWKVCNKVKLKQLDGTLKECVLYPAWWNINE